ncbi:MAG TPA: NAD(P)-binding domain-containing protein [Nitrospiria bacterium]|nr:NAD(P)-binding domain-containing protein [Nitrospiria bacterium]
MAKMKIGVLGSGVVGEVLSNGFIKHGYPVMRGSRDPKKLNEWKTGAGTNAKVGNFQEAAQFGELVVLAVKGAAAESAIEQAGIKTLSGKIVIDTTNPIAEAAAENGVLRFFTEMNGSLMEKLQKKAPGARFVKAFSCVGSAFMVNPQFKEGNPTMFICGNDETAKSSVKEILTQFGWESEDMGKIEAARAIEPLCMLWCIPGLLRNEWNHAFKLLKA